MLGSGSTLEWIGFFVVVLGLLAVDLGLVNRKSHVIHMREAAAWSAFWITISLIFNSYIWYRHGNEAAATFFAAYLVEKSLSVDNLFVFLVIFNYFRVDQQYQHRVLFWGIIGALVMRGVFIFAGTALLLRFNWMIYIFGAFLVYTGIKLGVSRGDQIDPAKSPVMRFATRRLRVTEQMQGARFFVIRDSLLWATPLLLVLMIIEFSDVIFAFDSVPAVLGISTDPFIVYSSNVFAILGLRALYFLLAAVLGKLRFLNLGLALILSFIGVKMLISHWVHIPTLVSLAVIASLLTLSIFASAAWPAHDSEQ
ncbi:MAG: TerC family protein [Candidatus Alcyoniella australis]|nr:TerC family protein [Candidatus Alcyoniella australis]